MEHSLFSGVCTALVTPFLNGEVNYPMMEQLLRRQIDAGISSVVIAGTTGEAATLTDEEKIALFQRCKTYTGDSCQIIAGTGSNDTRHAVSLACRAQQAGADALLVVSPYYNKATENGLVAHYVAIAGSVDIPVIIYNVPGRTGQDIPVGVYRRLSEIANITGVKEASTDIRKISKIKGAVSPRFTVWSGNDDLAVPTIALGGSGVVSVLSNVCPTETKTMIEAALNGDIDTAAAIHTDLLPLMELLFCDVNPVPVKAAMRLIGYDCGSCRLPLTDLSAAHRKQLESHLT